MSWNCVFDTVMEIKSQFINKFGEEELYDYSSDENCLKYWVSKLNNQEYIDLIKPLELNEYKDLLLIRYGRYIDVFSGESEAEFGSFWDIRDGFYKECRSLVIDFKNNRMVLTPFKKFRNVNECAETSEDAIAARIKKANLVEFSNKLDGSMQSARYYKGQIVMSGSQSLDRTKSYRLDLGYNMLKENYIEMLKDNPNFTFIFEFISLEDQHVVKYTKDQEGLYLIGIRNVTTGEELPYTIVTTMAAQYNIPTTEIYNKTFEEVLSSLDDKRSDEAEGFVINIDGFKVKLKYNDYVNMHKILSALSSPNLIIKNIADGTFDDFISKVPVAYKERIVDIAARVFYYVSLMNSLVDIYYEKVLSYSKGKEIKDYMIEVNERVPDYYKPYVRNRILNKEINYLKKRESYIKMSQIDNFLEKEVEKCNDLLW